MGITITSVHARERMMQAHPDARLAELECAKRDGHVLGLPNVAAWFLDDLTARCAPALPERIFTQGVADPPGPGDLDAGACVALAEALESVTSADVLACYAPVDGSDPEPGLKLARSVAALARHVAGDGGLAVF